MQTQHTGKIHSQRLRTFAVFLLQVLKALLAEAIASFVSAKPMSGMLPSSSAVDGSTLYHSQLSSFKAQDHLNATHLSQKTLRLLLHPPIDRL
jgi:hypothetical protein